MATVSQKSKVIFIMGATTTGKSKLSKHLAKQFDGEVINSDNIQVYKPLEIPTNKALTDEERRAAPQHSSNNVESDEGFGLDDHCYSVLKAIDKVVNINGRVPIIASGSNSYLEKLIEDPGMKFLEFFECCFIWVDVSMLVLYERVGKRIDEMVTKGTLIDQVRAMYVPGADYSGGILRRGIGAPEMENYFLVENDVNVDSATKRQIFAKAVEDIKMNTRSLVNSQVEKIKRLRNDLRWRIHRIDATDVYQKEGKEADKIWKEEVLKTSIDIVEKFLLY